MTSAGGNGVEDTPGGGALEQARAGVLRRLRARRSEIDAAIFARVLDVAPGAVGLGDPEYVEGLRAAVGAGVDYILEGIERGGEPGLQTPSAVVTQARRAARAGVGLDTVLRRYVTGLAVLEDFVMQEADHDEQDLIPPTQRTALRHLLETSALLLDRLIPAIADAYTQELERAGSSPMRAEGAPAPDRGTAAGIQGDEGQAGQEPKERGVPGARAAEYADRSSGIGQHRPSSSRQRARILDAVVEVVAERGFAGATVGLVVARARVSRRTFYELFDGLEDCLVAVMDRGLEQVMVLARREIAGAGSWQEGLRSTLAAVLSFFDTEPELACVLIVETLAGGPVVLAHRERLVVAFRLPMVERIEREVPRVSPLTAEGVMSSVLGIMHAHIVAEKPGPFVELLGPLMGLAMAPYLGARGVEAEIEQGDALARAILAGDARSAPSSPRAVERDGSLGEERDVALPALLGNPSARRARECLLFLAEQSGRGLRPSNREIAVGIGVAHQSQISRLLAYLAGESLVVKRSEGAGKRNSWRLTERGEEMVETLRRQEG